jgi:hypothetical protein
MGSMSASESSSGDLAARGRKGRKRRRGREGEALCESVFISESKKGGGECMRVPENALMWFKMSLHCQGKVLLVGQDEQRNA